MARIDAGTQPRTPVARKAPPPAAKAPATKSTAPQAKQQADSFERAKPSIATAQSSSKPVGAPPERLTRDFSSNARSQIKGLARSTSDNVQIAANRDGSETRTRTSTPGKNQTRTSELTTSDGPLRQAQTKYTRTDTSTFKGGSNERQLSVSAQSDLIGRTTSSQTRSQTQTRGDAANGGEISNTTSSTRARDKWGLETNTQRQTKQVKTGTETQNVAQRTTQSQTTGPLGTRSESTQRQSVTQDGQTTTTTSTKKSSGSELSTSSSFRTDGGKVTLGEQADWKKNASRTERTFTRETALRPSTADQGFSQASSTDRLSQAQKVGDVAGAAGLRATLAKGEIDKSKMHENNLVQGDPNTFVGTRHGYSGKGEVTLGADGLKASGNIEAKAGVYAEKKTPDIKEGEAGAQASAAAKLEARAGAEGQATLNTNGLDASGSIKAGVSAEASVRGKAQTQSVTVAGVPMNASAEGSLKVSAEATAEASGKAQITRNPPTAILEGKAGASAVAKAEAEGKVSAGPFSVKGNAYASAGAEATAQGSIGYEDGKLKLSGSLGAALGVGAGGGVAVEVDVAQIGEAAKNTATAAAQKVTETADVNNDGRLGVDDAQAAASNAAQAVRDTASNAAQAVRDTASNAVNAVQDTAKNAVNKAADKVKSLFGW